MLELSITKIDKIKYRRLEGAELYITSTEVKILSALFMKMQSGELGINDYLKQRDSILGTLRRIDS